MLNRTQNIPSIDGWKSLPEEWNNDERMNALFSQFRNRDINPLHYDGKLNFWTKTINQFAHDFELMKINQKSLEDNFIRKGVKPKCLNLVLESLQKENKILTRNDFIKQQQQQKGWVSYAFDKLVWSPLTWTTKYLYNTASQQIASKTTQPANNWVQLNSSLTIENESLNDSSNVNYIFVDIINKKSNDIHDYLINKITYPELDCVIDYENFQKTCSNEFNIKNDDDVELILINLIGKKSVIVSDTLIKDRKLIKFSQKLVNNSNLKISELETSYYVLKLSEAKLDKQINLLNTDIENSNKEIKLLLKQKLQQHALKLLKKRKNLERQLDLKHQQIDNLHAIMFNMQQADTSKQTIEAFSKSAETMKNINKEFDLDKIDELMFDIQDNLKISSEIENTLSKSVIANNDVDEEELEEELNELIKQKSTNIDDKKMSNVTIDDLLNDLPNIPDDSFSSIKSPTKTSSH